MSETKNPGDKTISVERKKTLTLSGGRNVEQGTVRQSFSHGRTKAVVVEKKRPRTFAGQPDSKPDSGPVKEADKSAAVVIRKPPPARRGGLSASSTGGAGAKQRNLTDGEMGARAQALAEARVREEAERERLAEESRRRAEAEERAKLEREESARQAVEDEKRLADEEAERQKNDPDSVPQSTQVDAAPKAVRPAARQPEPPVLQSIDEAPDPNRKTSQKQRDDAAAKGAVKAIKRPKAVDEKPARRVADDRRKTKLTITSATEGDNERSRSLASLRRKREKEKRAQMQGTREKISREVILPETITVTELANRMAERAVDVIKLLMKQGHMMRGEDVLDMDTAELIAEELGHTVKRVAESDVELGIFRQVENDEDATQGRPPVVTIMGHVDHGKTSLLDAYRESNVVSGEAGGITQHIGAYQVEQNGQKITFIDTPGHAAFTSMRARGAKVTDVVILVVAADDGVKPQTIEAIHHAKAAEVPIIVAINKIDKPAADPNRVRTELLQHEIVVESMGGETLDVEVSALKGTNLDGLLETILLQTELLELKSNPARSAEGVVVEARLDKGRGPVATMLVQKGTLRVGEILVAGSEWGRVRALLDDHGKQTSEAGPSMPVEVLGFQAAPLAGDQFAVVENESRAREISEYRKRMQRDMGHERSARGSLEQMLSKLKVEGREESILVIKGDVQGSVEAIVAALENLNTDEVAARIIHSGVGGITESDITLAEASNATVVAFNVRANNQARDLAEANGIEIRYYNIIYDLVDDVKAVLSGMLAPERRETFIGYATVLQVFNVSKTGKVAGCRVTEGNVERGAGVRLLRDNVVIHEGKLSTLKRFKDEVKDVVSGQECGMGFENYQDLREGDQIECFRVQEVERSL